MNENQKPFACNITGCEMTFTNEDHLNWHHKKHDMVLNLGIANKNVEVADQTPTPTRFIRNCEEVGLFQDLQNVNPFDETFKKAIESAKAGTLQIPETASSNDDTLHTPHIILNVVTTESKYSDKNNVKETNQSNNFSIDSNLVILSDSESEDLKEKPSKDKQINLKDKLKETIINKGKPSVTIRRLIKISDEDQKPKAETEADMQKRRDEREKIREMNRAAQIRCRKRKKIQSVNMEKELKILKYENSRLNGENQDFRKKFYDLKELLLKHKKDHSSENSVLVKNIEEILNSPILSKNVLSDDITKEKTKKVPIIKPMPLIQKSVFIPVAQLALLPNNLPKK